MNINNINSPKANGATAAEQLAFHAQQQGRNKDAARGGTGRLSDRVDTSELSKIMANSARALRSQIDVRPDKVAQFKPTIHNTTKLPDRVVEAIISRLASQ